MSESPSDVASVAPIGLATRVLDDGERAASTLIQLIIFVAIVSTAVYSISELAARESVLSLMTARVNALRSEVTDQSRTASGTNTPTAHLLKQVDLVQELRRDAEGLIAIGSHRSISEIYLAFLSVTSMTFFASSSEPARVWQFLNPYERTGFNLLSSDYLLAVAMLACGAIGAMISALRTNERLTMQSIILGLASGFITYLVIKGGKHVFLIQPEGILIAFNPYGSAFAALLAGLFTERAHELLRWLVDDLVERIRAAASSKRGSAGTSKAGPRRKRAPEIK